MTKRKQNFKINKHVLYGIGAIVVLVVAVLLFNSGKEAGSFQDNGLVLDDIAPPAAAPTQDLSVPVARVNGEEIQLLRLMEIQQSFAMQGLQMDEAQALDQAISQVLLFQEAERLGYSVTTEEAEAVLETELMMQGMGIDDLRNELEAQGESYDVALEEFKRQVMAQNYLDAVLSMPDISPEDAQAFYDENVEMLGGADAPPYAEIEPQIIAYLQSEIQQHELDVIIDELYAQAEIEYI